ncbi:MAG: beta-galactosidase, partial [Duncaniella sp.]|nr:beta-galactosidase [Duncaniella sp.]
MHRILLPALALLLALSVTAGSRLERQGSATRLIVDGKPFIIIGGETGNSMGSSPEDVDECIGIAKAHGYNTVLFPVSWELIEPQKGLFDFTSLYDIM